MNKTKLIKYITYHFNNGGEIENKHGKNIIKHSIGVYDLLCTLKCKEEICIAGLLHDTLEDTKISQTEIKDKFGEYVLELVIANTMDKSLDKQIAKQNMIDNCISTGYDALIIKSCDIYDSYRFYKSINNKSEIERTIILKDMILEKINDEDLNKIKIILDNIK